MSDVTGRCALLLTGDERSLVFRWRLATDVEVCAGPQGIWLRFPGDEQLLQRWREFPAGQRFTVLPDGQLVPAGRRVPKGRLPDGPWHPLAAWLRVNLPRPRLATAAARPAVLRMVRIGQEGGVANRGSERRGVLPRSKWGEASPGSESQATSPGSESQATAGGDPSLMVIPLGDWVRYVTDAPQVRLERWSFAAAEDGRVLVRGRPLPPLPGPRFVELQGLIVPAGWSWWPPIEPGVVRAALGLAAGQLALFDTAGNWELLRAEDFLQASRSAARQTAEAARG